MKVVKWMARAAGAVVFILAIDKALELAIKQGLDRMMDVQEWMES